MQCVRDVAEVAPAYVGRAHEGGGGGGVGCCVGVVRCSMNATDPAFLNVVLQWSGLLNEPWISVRPAAATSCDMLSSETPAAATTVTPVPAAAPTRRVSNAMPSTCVGGRWSVDRVGGRWIGWMGR